MLLSDTRFLGPRTHVCVLKHPKFGGLRFLGAEWVFIKPNKRETLPPSSINDIIISSTVHNGQPSRPNAPVVFTKRTSDLGPVSK